MFKKILEQMKFKYLDLWIPKQLILLWSFIWIASLFFPWITLTKKDINDFNSFNAIAWNIWYILIILFLIQIFLILSKNYKENLKLYSEVDLKNHFIIIFSGIFVIIINIIYINFTIWLLNIWPDVKYWQWPIFSIIWGLLLLIWWVLDRNKFKKSNSEIILEHLDQNRQKNKEKDNMKLPF